MNPDIAILLVPFVCLLAKQQILRTLASKTLKVKQQVLCQKTLKYLEPKL